LQFYQRQEQTFREQVLTTYAENAPLMWNARKHGVKTLKSGPFHSLESFRVYIFVGRIFCIVIIFGAKPNFKLNRSIIRRKTGGTAPRNPTPVTSVDCTAS
jgi:hypothetical protein